MLVMFEGLILCFWMLLICVVGIANGPVGLAAILSGVMQLIG